jgi:hypothetical protein
MARAGHPGLEMFRGSSTETRLNWKDVRPQPPPQIVGRRERLFEFLSGYERFVCELRDHGGPGVEAIFYQDEEFLISRFFATRELAIKWADQERKAIVEE